MRPENISISGEVETIPVRCSLNITTNEGDSYDLTIHGTVKDVLLKMNELMMCGCTFTYSPDDYPDMPLDQAARIDRLQDEYGIPRLGIGRKD